MYVSGQWHQAFNPTPKSCYFWVKKAPKTMKVRARWSVRWSHDTKYIQIFQMAQPNHLCMTHMAIVYLFKPLNMLSCVWTSALHAMFRGSTFWSGNSFWLKSRLIASLQWLMLNMRNSEVRGDVPDCRPACRSFLGYLPMTWSILSLTWLLVWVWGRCVWHKRWRMPPLRPPNLSKARLLVPM